MISASQPAWAGRRWRAGVEGAQVARVVGFDFAGRAGGLGD